MVSSNPAGSLLSVDASQIVEWLADVGSRWGLPPDACRVHGLLFLYSRPLLTGAIAAELFMTETAVETALEWLTSENLVTSGIDGWSTEADPWLLILQTLQRRREQELAPALAVLDPWRRGAPTGDAVVARQARRLLDLVDDLAAIDAGTQHFSPQALRRMIGIGGRAARLFGSRGTKR